MSDSFHHSHEPEPHAARTRAILAAHPEVRSLIGKNPWTVAIIAALVAAQLGLAAALAGAPWWMILLVAYGVGALIVHALFVMIHEAAHNLIFRRPVWNYLAGILANLPGAIPSAVSFKRYHLKHHSFQGVYELDADIPSEWEARLVGTSPLRKALWLLLFPVVQITRPVRIKQVPFVDRWILLNWAVVLAVDVVVWRALGPPALGYLFASLFFSIGLHPLGARSRSAAGGFARTTARRSSRPIPRCSSAPCLPSRRTRTCRTPSAASRTVRWRCSTSASAAARTRARACGTGAGRPPWRTGSPAAGATRSCSRRSGAPWCSCSRSRRCLPRRSAPPRRWPSPGRGSRS